MQGLQDEKYITYSIKIGMITRCAMRHKDFSALRQEGEGGGKKNDELNVFVRLKKECNRRGGRTDTPSGASWAPHSTATTKATRHHHLPARTTTSVATLSWIERGASVREG